MFTVKQIKAAHAKVKTGADYPRYVQDLKKLGIHHYDYVVENGSTVYYDKDGDHITSQAGETIQRKVSDTSSPETLKKHIFKHQQGGSDYPTFCIQAAEAGVERWSSDLEKMVCSYYDKKDNEIYAEPIPDGEY